MYTNADRARAAEVLSLARNRIGLKNNWALFWPIMGVGSYSIEDNLPTACTDGRDVKYGTGWLLKYANRHKGGEIVFTVLHEEGHKLFMHLHNPTYRRLWEVDRDIAGQALDHWLNLALVRMDPTFQFIDLPRDDKGTVIVLYDPQRFSGLTVVEIFRLLRQEKQQQQQQQSQQGQQGQGSFDEHDFENAAALPEEERKQIREQISRAVEEGQRLAKKYNPKGAGSMDVLMEAVRPTVRWKDYMRQFLQLSAKGDDEVTFRRLHRTYAPAGFVVPTSISLGCPPIVVACDLSASMWDGNPAPMQRVLNEMVSLLKTVRPERVDVLYWDTTVQAHETYKQHQLDGVATKTKPKGGGGTALRCVTEYMTSRKLKPSCVIVLTDGEVGKDWGGKWPAPVLFGVINKESVRAPHGRTVHITEDV